MVRIEMWICVDLRNLILVSTYLGCFILAKKIHLECVHLAGLVWLKQTLVRLLLVWFFKCERCCPCGSTSKINSDGGLTEIWTQIGPNTSKKNKSRKWLWSIPDSSHQLLLSLFHCRRSYSSSIITPWSSASNAKYFHIWLLAPFLSTSWEGAELVAIFHVLYLLRTDWNTSRWMLCLPPSVPEELQPS